MQYYNVPKDTKMTFPFSHAVMAGDFVYLSGQPSMDLATGKFIDGDFEQQFLQCFSNLKEVLASAGLSFQEVIKCTVFLTDMDDFSEMNRIYSEIWKAPYPARSCFAVKGLPLGAKVEVEMIAYKKQG